MASPSEQTEPSSPPQARASNARPDRRARMTTVLLLCLTLLLGFRGLDDYLMLGLFKTPQVLMMREAARAVVRQQSNVPGGVVYVRDAEGREVAIPSTLHFNRLAAINLLEDLEGQRQQCDGLTARIVAQRGRGEPDRARPVELSEATRLWHEAQDDLGMFLIVDKDRSLLVLAALQWPWLGNDPTELMPDELAGPFAKRPAAFESMDNGDWQGLLERAQQPRPWQVVESEIMGLYGVSRRKVRSLQAHVCCQDMLHAFDSPEALRQAGNTLERLVALTPSQVETVLAMRGAQALMNGGMLAFPPVIRMLDKHRELAYCVLQGCLWRVGVREQALSAVANLEGPDPERAENTLRAFGPFALEALQTISDRSGRDPGPAAERIRLELEEQWPNGAKGADALGSDPKKWLRWYRKARSAL